MYHYGFNGKEKDDEAKGSGEQYDYGFRIYDPRAGRFLSVDPISKSYPELTPYQFASNTPVQAIDINGLNQVKKEVADEIRRMAVPQAKAKEFPDRPEISDPTNSKSAYGLPENYIKKLEEGTIKGSGKVKTP